jgi:hypothetical protein
LAQLSSFMTLFIAPVSIWPVVWHVKSDMSTSDIYHNMSLRKLYLFHVADGNTCQFRYIIYAMYNTAQKLENKILISGDIVQLHNIFLQKRNIIMIMVQLSPWLLLKIIRDPGQNLVALHYWTPVKFFPCCEIISNITCSNNVTI